MFLPIYFLWAPIFVYSSLLCATPIHHLRATPIHIACPSVTTRLRTPPTGPRLTSGTRRIFRPAPWTPDTPTFPRLRGPLSVFQLTRHAYLHAFLPHQRTAHGQTVT